MGWQDASRHRRGFTFHRGEMKSQNGFQGHHKLPFSTKEAKTFEDCILVKGNKRYWLIIQFRDEFFTVRISKKKYEEMYEG